MMKPIWKLIVEHIHQFGDAAFVLQNVQSIQGGDINQSYHLQGVEKSYFLKLNRASLYDMFEAEVLGLNALAQTKTLRIPKVIDSGVVAEYAFLILEFMHLKPMNRRVERQFGQSLALLHQQPQAYFGWSNDNYIATNKQYNPRESDWAVFWQQRLRSQLILAAENGYTGAVQEKGAKLIDCIAHFFSGYQPSASLLHGDLWSGNYSADERGQATIYDPACYYGDREADIAMTELFGGLSADFYEAYNEVWPLDVGYKTRRELYNLYHILNHVNLFGASYLGQAERMISRLLAELSK